MANQRHRSIGHNGQKISTLSHTYLIKCFCSSQASDHNLNAPSFVYAPNLVNDLPMSTMDQPKVRVIRPIKLGDGLGIEWRIFSANRLIV